MKNIGYRQMWMILKQKYALTVKRYYKVLVILCMCAIIYANATNRSTVQMLMSVLDSQGAKRRKNHRLKRRVYQNKVNVVIMS